MSEDPKVYQVDLSKKYILIFPGMLPREARDKIRDLVREWKESDDPFLILPPGVRLVRVEEPSTIDVTGERTPPEEGANG